MFGSAPGAMRVIAAVVLAQGEARGLVAFRAVDTHVHALLVAGRDDAGAFARYVAVALRARLGLAVRFDRASIRPLESQRHLENAVDYVHRQEARHGVALDPFEEGSSLADLLGLRATHSSASLRRRHRRALPRRATPAELATLATLPQLVHASRASLSVDRLAASTNLSAAAGETATRIERAATNADIGVGMARRSDGAVATSSATIEMATRCDVIVTASSVAGHPSDRGLRHTESRTSSIVLADLVDAAAAALLLPALRGQAAEVVAARRAVAHVARGWPTHAIAAVLDVSTRSATRLRSSPPDAELVATLVRALAFRAARRAAIELEEEAPIAATP